jgi:chloride channel protein, CIC family
MMRAETSSKPISAVKPGGSRSGRSSGATPPVTQTREFWTLLAYAIALGVFGGFASLAVLGVITFGDRWYTDSDPGWFGGYWWWVGVTATAGLVVGLLRQLTRLPENVPDLFEDLRAEYVPPKLVPGTMVVSVVSLIGGASLGPEKVLGSIGGGTGSWIARRRRLGHEDSQVNTLAGTAGIFGGLFSSPLIVVTLILEVVRPGGRRFSKTLAANIAAGSVSFGIYFAIAGAVFLGAYRVPHYAFKDWQLLAGVPLGLFAALVTTVAAGFVALASRSFGLLMVSPILKSTLGGMIFGVVGVVLPLTTFSGGDQLSSVLNGARSLSVGLCLAILIAKMLTYAVSQGSGFVGGPIFPSLFIGGTAGILVHQAIPGVPLGLAFSCLLTAVLGSLAAAPLSMVLMTAFLTRGGSLQTAPVLITVVTAFLAVQGGRYFLTSRRRLAVRRNQLGIRFR